MSTLDEMFERLEARRNKPSVRMRRMWYRVKTRYMKIVTWPRRAREKHRKGYNYESLWGLDSYLAEMLGRAFRELADVTHGYPSNLTKGDIYNPTREATDEAFEEWQRILREIASGFERYAEEENYDDPDYVKNFKEDADERHDAVKNSLSLMAEWYPSFWD